MSDPLPVMLPVGPLAIAPNYTPFSAFVAESAAGSPFSFGSLLAPGGRFGVAAPAVESGQLLPAAGAPLPAAAADADAAAESGFVPVAGPDLTVTDGRPLTPAEIAALAQMLPLPVPLAATAMAELVPVPGPGRSELASDPSLSSPDRGREATDKRMVPAAPSPAPAPASALAAGGGDAGADGVAGDREAGAVSGIYRIEGSAERAAASVASQDAASLRRVETVAVAATRDPSAVAGTQDQAPAAVAADATDTEIAPAAKTVAVNTNTMTVNRAVDVAAVPAGAMAAQAQARRAGEPGQAPVPSVVVSSESLAPVSAGRSEVPLAAQPQPDIAPDAGTGHVPSPPPAAPAPLAVSSAATAQVVLNGAPADVATAVMAPAERADAGPYAGARMATPADGRVPEQATAGSTVAAPLATIAHERSTDETRLSEGLQALLKRPVQQRAAAAELAAVAGSAGAELAGRSEAVTRAESLAAATALHAPTSAASPLHPAEPAPMHLPGQPRLATPQWNNALGERTVWLSAQNNKVAEIQLDPPELGALKIRVQVNQDQVSLSFSSPHGAVREAVEQAMPRLRELFAEQGLTLTDSSVSDQSSGGERERRDGLPGYAGDEGVATEAGAVPAGGQAAGRAVSLVDYYA